MLYPIAKLSTVVAEVVEPTRAPVAAETVGELVTATVLPAASLTA